MILKSLKGQNNSTFVIQTGLPLINYEQAFTNFALQLSAD